MMINKKIGYLLLLFLLLAACKKDGVHDRDIPEEVPAGMHKNGVTVDRETKEVTFALTAPGKASVHLLGSFNGFRPGADNALQYDEEQGIWWMTVSGLDFQQAHTYQFLVDGNLKLADPYARLVLDPDNDAWVAANPSFPAYPKGETEGMLSVLTLDSETPYAWKSSSFQRPDPYDLVIYELHLRDFLETHDYSTLRDSISYLKRLGINAVELMPVQEFEGNSSWGYNPSFHFATDKYYGTAGQLKAFIDACHQEGIAVLLDVVLNHAFGQSPMVRLYEQAGMQAGSPWFNRVPTHPYNVGTDFNHESAYTRAFAKDVMAYWMDEFRVDGFRFDLSKGFTQKNSGTTDAGVQAWTAYDAGRIAIWKDYYGFIREKDKDFYVILEHFADDREERELAAEGMFLWNNLNYAFNEATMGYVQNTDLDRLFADAHGFGAPQLISYMESHDEERMMFKNLAYGAVNGDYAANELETALARTAQAAAFFLLAPGPKMIWQFGELGYDVSIDVNGRTGEKPVKWDYLEDAGRQDLFKHYTKLIRWKTGNPIFRNPAVEYEVKGAVKYYVLREAGQEVLLLANMDMQAHDFNLPESLRKTWYNNQTDAMEDWQQTEAVHLEAGTYYILSINKLNN